MSPLTRKPKPRPHPDRIYVCWQGFVTAGVSVTRGERLRGSHPLVVGYFHRFLEDGVPAHEWPSEIGNIEYAQPEQRPIRTIPPARQVRARQTFTVTVDGTHHTVGRGLIVDRDDPVVHAAPDQFETVPQPLEAA